ncbi:hypothetical protein, partial [Streptomyces sp. NPDC057325]|uniref:hypothetical protein n=1 Tax=unclassified Streptomyces TaxID=2593676 RepID=UPI00363DB053
TCGAAVRVDGEFARCVIDDDEHDAYSEHVTWLDVEKPGLWLVWEGLSTDSRVEERPMCCKGSGPEDTVDTDWCYGPHDHPGRCTWEAHQQDSA